MDQKYRCIKDYYCYNNPTFITGEIYDGYDAIITRIYAKPEYILKYKYPHSTHFSRQFLSYEKLETYFVKLSEERNTKINQILP